MNKYLLVQQMMMLLSNLGLNYLSLGLLTGDISLKLQNFYYVLGI